MEVINKIKIYKEEEEIIIDFKDLNYNEHVEWIERVFSRVMKQYGYDIYKIKK